MGAEVGWLEPHFQAGCFGWVLPAGVLRAAATPAWPLLLLAESFSNCKKYALKGLSASV